MKSPDINPRYFAGITPPSPDVLRNLTNPNSVPSEMARVEYQKYLESVQNQRAINEKGRLRLIKIVPFIPRVLCLATAAISLFAGYESLPTTNLPTIIDMIKNYQGASFLPAFASVIIASYLTHLAFKNIDS